jgi:hypothetical protein
MKLALRHITLKHRDKDAEILAGFSLRFGVFDAVTTVRPDDFVTERFQGVAAAATCINNRIMFN